MTKSLFERIIEFVFFIFLLILIIQVILKLTGHSSTIGVILTTGLGLVISYLLIGTLQIAQFMGKTSEFMDNSKESFRMIRNDIGAINENIGILKEDIGGVKRKLKIYS